MSEILPLTEEHYPEAVRIVAEAYPSMGVVTNDDRRKMLERFREGVTDRLAIPYGVFRDNRLLGVFRNWDFVLNVRNHQLPIGGLGMVAVDLTHKKEHVAKDIVEFFIRHYDERGCALVSLWPFRVDFYRDMGFGLGGRMFQYRLKPEYLPAGRGKEHVRYLTAADIPAINECQDRMFERRNGTMQPSETYLRSQMKWAEALRFVGCEIDGRLDGYLIYRFRKPGHPVTFMDYDMEVWQIIYHTPEALSELLSFLRSQLDQVGQIFLQIPEDEFYFLLRNPTYATGSKLIPTGHESHIAGVGIMYRVVDVRRLFGQLKDCDFNGVSLRLKLNLTDSFFPKNAGTTVVQFDSGKPHVVGGDQYDVAIALDIAEFSSLLMGAVRFRSLVTYGLATISDPRHLDKVDRLFAYHERPICYTGF